MIDQFTVSGLFLFASRPILPSHHVYAQPRSRATVYAFCRSYTTATFDHVPFIFRAAPYLSDNVIHADNLRALEVAAAVGADEIAAQAVRQAFRCVTFSAAVARVCHAAY